MRMLALLALAVSASLSCAAPAAAPATRTDHVVVSLIPPNTPEDRLLREFAVARRAEVVRTLSIVQDRAFLLGEFRRLRPEFVTIFVPAAQLDANTAFAMQDLAAAVDEDLFTDFAYGFVPVVDARMLGRWWQAVKIAEYRDDKRLFKSVWIDMATVSDENLERLEWASGLPRKTVRVTPGDLKWLRDHQKDIEEADLLLLTGQGNNSGVYGGLSVSDVDRLKLDSQVAFLGVPGSGVVGPYFAEAAGTARRGVAQPEQCLALAFFRQGAVAVLAPLDEDDPSTAKAELDLATLSNAPLGHVIKRQYDAARCVRTLKAEPLPVREDGRETPGEFKRQSRVLQVLARVLLGDPSMQPFHRPAQDPVRAEPAFERRGPDGRPEIVARYVVEHPEARHAFLDPITGKDRLHIRHDLPAGTREAFADLDSVELDGKKVPAKILGQAVEEWEGRARLHIVVGGEAGTLARRGLAVTLAVRAR